MSLQQRDRRCSPRLNVEGAVRLLASRAGKRVMLHGHINDLSEGGVSVHVPSQLLIGERLEIEMTLPYLTGSIGAVAVVRSCEHYRYGLQFTGLYTEQQKALARACEVLALLK